VALSCGNCLEILGSSNSWSPKGLSRPLSLQQYEGILSEQVCSCTRYGGSAGLLRFTELQCKGRSCKCTAEIHRYIEN